MGNIWPYGGMHGAFVGKVQKKMCVVKISMNKINLKKKNLIEKSLIFYIYGFKDSQVEVKFDLSFFFFLFLCILAMVRYIP